MKKTSASHPLIINGVEVPGTQGTIGMTLCPGKVQKNGMSGEWARDLPTDLQAIVDWGASSLVTLLEPHELMDFKVQGMADLIPPGMEHLTLPIPDGGIPDEAWERSWALAGPKLRASLHKGKKVVIHCLGGLGRTGMVTARLLVEFGMDPKQAIQAVRSARRGAIENKAQEHYVLKQKALQDQALAPGPRVLIPYHRITPERASRFRGCLLGGAAGDALGAPVEFMDLQSIRARFGVDGIRDYVPAYGRVAAITDDTQMSLFTAEGLIRAYVRGRMRGLSTIPGVVSHAYQRWLLTQGHKSKVKKVGKDGWLWTHKELFSSRAPGTTCLSALKAYTEIADPGPARNNSKGCGTIMRVAPVGLYAASTQTRSEEAFKWGCEVAALTHGHPTGQLSAGVQAMVVCELVVGTSLRESIQKAKIHLATHPEHEETLASIEAALGLASNQNRPEEAIAELGQGWVADEALGISLYCALTARNLEEGVIRAVNITGDSDSTGAITGNILGAALGVHEIPDRWLAPLELKECITAMADDLATINEWALSEYGHDSAEKQAEQDYWFARYPGW